MNHRQFRGLLACAILVAIALALWSGTGSVKAQSQAVELLRICARGSSECSDLRGGTWTVSQSQQGTVTIPKGCGVISRAAELTLNAFAASVARPGGPAMNATGYPRYSNPKSGDKIQVFNDTQQCCVSDTGDKVVDCQYKAGEKVVKVVSGPRS